MPVAALFAVMALDTAHVIWGYGSAAADFGNFAPSLALFGLGLVLFTAHYLVLRGFYALEQTRRVFWIQCAIAATNIVAAILLTHDAPPAQIAPRLVLAYACSYGVGAAISYTLLSREVGGLAGAPPGAVPGAARDRGRDQRRRRLGAARAAATRCSPAPAPGMPCSTSPWSAWSTSRSTSGSRGCCGSARSTR